MKKMIRQIGLILIDGFSINAVLLLLLALEQNKANSQLATRGYWKLMLIVTLTLVICFKLCGLYDSLWRYASGAEFFKIVMACSIGSFLTYSICKMVYKECSKEFLLNICIGYVFCIAGSRILYRIIRYAIACYRQGRLPLSRQQDQIRTMIVGAGEAAKILIRECNLDLMSKRKIVVAVDDDYIKQGAKINGVPIKGDIGAICSLVELYKISEIIIAIPSANKQRISEILEICSKTNCKLKIFPGIDKSLKKDNVRLIRNVNIEDLLGREEIILNNDRLNFILHNKTVLVTGGGGSIGSEICRQIVQLPIAQLIIFDIYENTSYSLQVELTQQGIPCEKIKVIIGSIRDKKKLMEVFTLYKPDIVFHAAAHKHVPLMEACPQEAIKNNVRGTLNVLECTAAFNVKKFVLVSTDKAVNPTSVMGVTKRIGEMLVEAINAVVPSTEFVAVRFGNVLGSNGSLIPLFKMQLEKGGPLTVTHPEIERYFMTIPEAVRLILEALSFAKGGEIFVLDMGRPVKILDLAKKFIRLSGLEEGKDIEIKITGLRPGEKLYEELLMAEEGLGKTSSDKIFIGKPEIMDYDYLLKQISELEEDMNLGRDIRKKLKEIVPSYQTMEEANGKVTNG